MFEVSHPEPPVKNLKDQLWEVTEWCWIETGLTGYYWTLLNIDGAPGKLTHMEPNGRLNIAPRYLLDGSSAPLIGRWLDRKFTLWGAMFHDPWYEAGRAEQLELEDRDVGDVLYADIMGHWGAGAFWQKALYWNLRWFGEGSFTAVPDYSRRRAATL